jgi:zinc finger HIT domain-containing protein 1
VRKILQSQKTFANYLDDYQALLALAETNPAAAAALNPANAAPPKTAPPSTARNSPAPPPPEPKSTAASKRSAAAAKRAAAKEAKEAEEAAAAKAKADAKSKAPEPPAESSKDVDVDMTDAPVDAATQPTQSAPGTVPPVPNQPPQSYPPDGTILPAYQKPPPPAHPSDNDPLLVSRVPPFPADDELRALMTAPPLSYLEARATWGEEETRYPTRVFCEVCGYWGRVRCMKCSTRVCALDCLEMHKVECVTRYGL